MYNEKVIKLFKSPKNVGELKNADGVGEIGNAACGDIMKMYIKVENDKIADVKFKTFGCAAAIVSTSIATEMMKNKNIDDVLKITNDQILDQMGDIPKTKIHCSVMAEEVIYKTIENYKEKQKRKSA
jgi:nitrogen fixation NifU-like protein